eukprot:g51766.t1
MRTMEYDYGAGQQPFRADAFLPEPARLGRPDPASFMLGYPPPLGHLPFEQAARLLQATGMGAGGIMAGGSGVGVADMQRRQQQQQEVHDGMWECPDCKNMNYATRQKCNRRSCGKPKPDPRVEPVMQMWACPSCGNINFPTRTVCNMRRCQAKRPDQVEQPPDATKTAAASAAGMWACPECGNQNYAHRTVCNMRNCQAKRPNTSNQQATSATASSDQEALKAPAREVAYGEGTAAEDNASAAATAT